MTEIVQNKGQFQAIHELAGSQPIVPIAFGSDAGQGNLPKFPFFPPLGQARQGCMIPGLAVQNLDWRGFSNAVQVKVEHLMGARSVGSTDRIHPPPALMLDPIAPFYNQLIAG